MAIKRAMNIDNLNFAYTLGRVSLTELIKRLPEEPRRFYMFGIPNYNNLGDQAVAYAEKAFFKRVFPEITYIEILETQTDQAINELKPLLRDSDMIGYTGGGNIGNVYLDHEEPRRKVFSTFVNNKTISFPQSVNFEDTEQGQEELRKSQEAYNKNPNLTIVARETQSLDYFKKNFDANVIYTSDIVASLKPDPSEFKREGVLFIMRQDSEKVINEKLLEQLSYKLNNVGDEVEQTDTVLPFKASDSNADTAPDLDEVRISERGWLIERKLEEIKASEAVVTDRLHGMIFCVLTKTPCLVFDNSYGKASASYYNWFEDLDYIKHTTENDPDKLAPMIEELKGYEHSNYHDFTHSYDELIDLIKK